MKLIDLLVQELPKRGGWPEPAVHAWCDRDGEIRFRRGGCVPDFYPSYSVDVEYRIPSCDYEDDVKYIITRQQYETALVASQQSTRNGEGVPPVGCECEAKYLHAANAEWFAFRCVAVDCEVAFGWAGKEPATLTLKDFEFRPIRNEAELKRQQIAQEMCNLFGSGIKIDEKHGYGTTWLEVYDAISEGKIPGVKLAD